MNVNIRKLSLLLPLVFAVGFIWARDVTKPLEMFSILIGSFAVYGLLMRYIFVGREMATHVSVQADANRRSMLSMWGEMFKKTLLYLFLPAAILTAIMVGIALFVTRNQ